MNSALSAVSWRGQKHPPLRTSEHVPVSVIAVNSSPPPPRPAHSRGEMMTRQRHASGTAVGWCSERPVSVDVWAAGTGDSDGASMRRCASATLSNNDCPGVLPQSSTLQSPLSSSTHHLGSSVTFCNAVPTSAVVGRFNASVDLSLIDELTAIKRSSSLTQAGDVVLRPASGTPTTTNYRTTKQQHQQKGQQQRLPHTRGKLASLTLPVITCDGVTSVPTSPLRHIRTDVTGFGSTRQLHPGTTMSLGGGSRAGGSSRTILVTPQGSFLSVNQSPIEFRESTVLSRNSIGD